jgi:hypothetical protein
VSAKSKRRTTIDKVKVGWKQFLFPSTSALRALPCSSMSPRAQRCLLPHCLLASVCHHRTAVHHLMRRRPPAGRLLKEDVWGGAAPIDRDAYPAASGPTALHLSRLMG